MTSSHHAPYTLGDTHATMTDTKDATLRGQANLKNPASVRIAGLLAANPHFSLSHKLPTPMSCKLQVFVAFFK
jgi:hypothetical protein